MRAQKASPSAQQFVKLVMFTFWDMVLCIVVMADFSVKIWEIWELRSYLMQIVRAPSQGSLPPLEFLNIGSFDFKFQDQRCMWSLIIFLHSPLVDNGQTPSMSSHVFAIFLDLFFLYLKVCDWSSLFSGIKICVPKKKWEPVLKWFWEWFHSTFDSFNSETTNIARTWKRESYSEVLWCLFWNQAKKQDRDKGPFRIYPTGELALCLFGTASNQVDICYQLILNELDSVAVSFRH